MNDTTETILANKVLNWLINLLAGTFSGICLILIFFFQQIFPNLTIDKIERLLLLRIILFLSAILFGLIPYILHKINIWPKIEKQYELKEIISGFFVYVYKKTNKPLHYLCTNCYKDKKISILQIGDSNNRITYFCPSCKMKLINDNNEYD